MTRYAVTFEIEFESELKETTLQILGIELKDLLDVSVMPALDLRIAEGTFEVGPVCKICAVCVSSDSKLPECKCWCAECQENRQ
jgi:hypothetical protein